MAHHSLTNIKEVVAEEAIKGLEATGGYQ